MNSEEKLLWDQIENFQFDKPNTQFKFAQRLARENGWSQNYTNRVILEYKKFLFMCCVSPVMVTPSDPVDQAWHLHLTYTKSYWVDLCEGILKKRIHHNPTEGGKAESTKFDDLYTKTRALYVAKFNDLPPKDIWQDNEERFSDVDFERINMKKNWVIPKPNFKKLFQLIGILLFSAGSIYATTEDGEIDWAVVIIIAIIVFVVIIILIAIFGGGNKKNRGGGSSSSSSGCSSGGGWFIFGCSSCSSGSGCSSSGCSSGCGGGCGGGCSS